MVIDCTRSIVDDKCVNSNQITGFVVSNFNRFRLRFFFQTTFEGPIFSRTFKLGDFSLVGQKWHRIVDDKFAETLGDWAGQIFGQHIMYCQMTALCV